MNKQQQKAWIKAFIQLWEAGEPSSDNNFEDTGSIQDALSETFAMFCDKYNLPQVSADELLVQDIWDDTKQQPPEGKTFFWKDKTGRGATATIDALDASDTEENWDGVSLGDWAQEAEEGDEWENATDKYICTKG